MEFTAKYQKVQNRWKRQRIIKICPSGYFVWCTMNRLNWKKIEIAIIIVFSIKILKFCHLESDLICHHLISLTEILVLLSDLLFPHLNKLHHYTAIFFKKVTIYFCLYINSHQSVQSLIHIRFFVTSWTIAYQASLSIINSWSLLKPTSIKLVMPSNHLILFRPLLLLPSNFPSIRILSNESVLHIRWPEYWSFSFSISPSNKHSGLISFRREWLDLLAVQGTLKILL